MLQRQCNAKKFMEASNNMVIVENGTSNFDQRVSAFVYKSYFMSATYK